MKERIDPVEIAGQALNRHTFSDDEGNPLPDGQYHHRRPAARRHPRWLFVLVLVLAVLLIAAAAF